MTYYPGQKVATKVDTATATTLEVGPSTATKVEIADAGIVTEIQGSFDVTEATTLDQVTIDTTDGDFSVSGSKSIHMSSTEAVADAITLTTNGGAAEQIVVTNTQGTNAAAIDLVASAGGIKLDSAAVIDFDMPVPTPGAGIQGVAAISSWLSHGKAGATGVVKAEFLLDLTGLKSINTANDIIGAAVGGAAYLGQITAAMHGTVVQVRMECLEAPTTGDTDIDLYSATEDTGVYNGLITDLTETAIITAGGAWSQGDVKYADTIAADQYLYLACGSAGGVDGTYDAGKFLITIYGTN